MRIGRYRHRISIETPDRDTGRLGGATITGWTVEAERWAWVEAKPQSGSEVPEGNQPVARGTYIVRLRYYPDITPAHSIVHDGKRLQVQSISHVDSDARETELVCVETKEAA